MPGPTVQVVITLEGVRKAHLPRLQTAIKGQLTRFGRKIKVAVEEPKPPRKERRGRT